MKQPEQISAPKGTRGGFTIVEVIIAMMVLSVGMLAMAASTGYVSSEIRNATWNTQRAFSRNQVIEQLRAMPFDSITGSATSTVGRYTMTWGVTAVTTNLVTVNVIASGPAYRLGRGSMLTVADTVTVQIARP